ncbi:CDP-diacylglycerol--serine O-phosphatidyltransferase [Aliikangiella coralliicola]|uniref:CDP-diacylglycerol--serine O-phosphatidyltransferase n=1 Tax=Aliikangiella coralliicola TaxID=2592383 RepID=A0A545UJI8_9GAMM|nr:CDP-diacylglycerol--serine O-phosphatidyltransferase [Aliikangiella coralliicola]TQV89631.1 CDP-diacylglycerol--serine O-phosphatidyltransferase [Aliikangiella coralliicola]
MQFPGKGASFINTLSSISTEAENISIIETTLQFREKLLGLIKDAQQRIYMTALYLQDDASGQEVLSAIYEAKQANPKLDVKIFVDFSRAQRGLMGQPESIGNVRLYREYAGKFEHQIDILGVPVKSKEMLGVLHLKGFVFDDTLLYSGASLNDIYLQQNSRYRYDRYHVIKDKKLTDSMVSFMQRYLATSSAVKSLTEPTALSKKQLKPLIRQFKKSLRVGNYQFTPDLNPLEKEDVAITPLLGFGGRRNPLNMTIYDMVKNTRDKIIIFTPYFNFPNKVSKAIRRILKNGKKVNIVVGDKVANDFYIPEDQAFNRIGIVPYIYETNLRKFVKRNQKFVDTGLLNIHLWLHDDNSFHLKGMSCDDSCHLITGHNINPRAWSLDLENGILIQDPNQQLKEKFQHEYQQILTHTNRIDHFEQIQTINDYPDAACKLMKNVKRAKLDSILNRLL